MGNDSPPHLSPNLHFNFQIKMPKPKLRAKIGLLKTLQQDATSNVLDSRFDSGSKNLGVVLVGRASMRRLIDLCGAIQARDGKIDGSQENVDKDGLRGRSYEMCR